MKRVRQRLNPRGSRDGVVASGRLLSPRPYRNIVCKTYSLPLPLMRAFLVSLTNAKNRGLPTYCGKTPAAWVVHRSVVAAEFRHQAEDPDARARFVAASES